MKYNWQFSQKSKCSNEEKQGCLLQKEPLLVYQLADAAVLTLVSISK
jgi:hypothetical protein